MVVGPRRSKRERTLTAAAANNADEERERGKQVVPPHPLNAEEGLRDGDDEERQEEECSGMGVVAGAATHAPTKVGGDLGASCATGNCGTGAVSNAELKRLCPRVGRRGAPQAFAKKLYEMLSRESRDVLCWNSAGTAFHVKDPETFEDDIIMKYYRHSKFSSFQRQLSLYRFSKIRDGEDRGAYAHPNFLRDEPEQLLHVRRAVARSGGGVDFDVAPLHVPSAPKKSKSGKEKVPLKSAAAHRPRLQAPPPAPAVKSAKDISAECAEDDVADIKQLDATGFTFTEMPDFSRSDEDPLLFSKPIFLREPEVVGDTVDARAPLAGESVNSKHARKQAVKGSTMHATPVKTATGQHQQEWVEQQGQAQQLGLVEQLTNMVADVDLSTFLGWGKRGPKVASDAPSPVRARSSTDRPMSISFDYDALDEKYGAGDGCLDALDCMDMRRQTSRDWDIFDASNSFVGGVGEFFSM
jgi:hypothetical protein